MYAIVDIETTGSYAAGNSITEIAICVHDGKEPVAWFESLVKPDHQIPLFITSLTGITNEMVASAPTFEELMPEITALTEGMVFVAHQVHFDYSFIRKAFEFHGESFERNKLCTVRLGRKLLPGLPSYSLGKLCASLDIPHQNAHRAMGDVRATVSLFETLLKADTDNHILSAAKRNSGESILPANLPKEQFIALPEAPGVYYFKDGTGKILYIGKAQSIKKRVRSHFSGNDNDKKSEAFKRHIHEVSFKKTGNELVALLLEDHEIRKYWPQFNKAQKTPRRQFGIYRYEDQNGYYRLAVNKTNAGHGAVQSYGKMSDARNAIGRLVSSHALCPTLCGMGSLCEFCAGDTDSCSARKATPEYNQKVLLAMKDLQQPDSKCAILGMGREEGEQSVILLDGDQYLGFGFVDSASTLSFDELLSHIERQPESTTIRGLLSKHLQSVPKTSLHYF